MSSRPTRSKARRTAPPPCTRLGRQCRSLPVLLRIGELNEGQTSLDHEATWLLGHTQRITFGALWADGGDLYVDAVLHVPCRYLDAGAGRTRCTAHGFSGPPLRPAPHRPQARRLDGERFLLVDGLRLETQELEGERGLPVLAGENPCAGALCRTADRSTGAACCRDLQIEIMCTRRQRRLEALVRARKRPYLCKVTRPGAFSLEAEVISACGYLAGDLISCTLHGRRRADGRPAKPDLCSDWPPKGKGLHPGCVFAPVSSKASPSPGIPCASAGAGWRPLGDPVDAAFRAGPALPGQRSR